MIEQASSQSNSESVEPHKAESDSFPFNKFKH